MYAGVEHEKPYHSTYYEVKHLGLDLQHRASGEQHQQSDGCIAYKGHVNMPGIEGRYDYYAADVVDYCEVVRNILREEGTLEPSSAMMPSEKAMSVAMGMAAPSV